MGFLSLVIFLEKKERERRGLTAAGDAAWEFKGTGAETAAQLDTFAGLETGTASGHLAVSPAADAGTSGLEREAPAEPTLHSSGRQAGHQ